MFIFSFKNRPSLLLALLPAPSFLATAEGHVVPGVASLPPMVYFQGKINLKG